MDSNRQWLAWIAIGIGALALLVSLNSWGGSQQMMGMRGVSMPQTYSQQPAAPQSNAAPPSTNSQQPAAPQGNAAPDTNTQRRSGHGGDQQRGDGDQQHGQAPQGMQGMQGGRRQGGGGFGLLSWLSLPFNFLTNGSRLLLVALLIMLGVWLLRGRQPRAAASAAPAGPAPAPTQPPTQQPTQSPTGEWYIEESGADEPRDQA